MHLQLDRYQSVKLKEMITIVYNSLIYHTYPKQFHSDTINDNPAPKPDPPIQQ